MDAVILWHNEEDEDYRYLFSQYVRDAELEKQVSRLPESGNSIEEIDGDDETANVSQSVLKLWRLVDSINQHAPVFSKIYLVTPSQDPRLDNFISGKYLKYIPIEIVDHKTLFKGYEFVLPTFNRVAVETLIWKIPGLSDQFVYFRNNEALEDNYRKEDFFDRSGRSVVRGEKKKYILPFSLGLLNYKGKRISSEILNTAELQKKKYYRNLKGPVLPMLKRVLSDYFEYNTGVMEENISYRFPTPSQFDICQLYLYLAEDSNLLA